MQQDYPEPVLHQNFSSLGFSKDFITFATAHHCPTPADLLQLSVFQLESLDGFNQNKLFEFVRFLEKEKLGDYLNEF